MDLYRQLSAPEPDTGRFHGVMIGIVTNNNDPDKLGRVKLKFPWLAEDVESTWARVASPAAGAKRGLFAIPEVNDEVLVAFEHGLLDRPFVLGGLWNGKDEVPPNTAKPADVRSLTSRAGHVIRLDDTQQAEKIEIVSSKGNAKIVLDAAKGTITISTDADLVLESRNGAVKITGSSIELKAVKGPVKVDGVDVEVKATASLKQEASGTAELKANGPLTLRGATVNIN